VRPGTLLLVSDDQADDLREQAKEEDAPALEQDGAERITSEGDR
jgi:hypothetical protein